MSPGRGAAIVRAAADSTPENRWRRPPGIAYLSAMTTASDENRLKRAFLEKDRSFDGIFFAGVTTTGIFCRPGCPAKAPLAAHIRIFRDAAAAAAAGFRPCRRCRPADAYDEPEWVRRLLAAIERDPAARITDADLSALGLDPSTVRRHFQKRYGRTFHAYARAKRLDRARTLIRGGQSVLRVQASSDFSSASGFADAFVRLFGRSPADPEGETIVVDRVRTPIGEFWAGETEKGLCLFDFVDRAHSESVLGALGKRYRAAICPGRSRFIEMVAEQSERYFAGMLERFSVPLDVRGSAFECAVWEALQEIPFGETTNYKAIAERIGLPDAARAVGRANGANRIAIVIPCHRVVPIGGNVGGYSGGAERKRRLLELEREVRARRITSSATGRS